MRQGNAMPLERNYISFSLFLPRFHACGFFLSLQILLLLLQIVENVILEVDENKLV